MGGHTLFPIPRAVNLEAYHYPRQWKRNMFIIYSSLFLINLQIHRYSKMCKTFSMKYGEYMDWGSYDAPKKMRYD